MAPCSGAPSEEATVPRACPGSGGRSSASWQQRGCSHQQPWTKGSGASWEGRPGLTSGFWEIRMQPGYILCEDHKVCEVQGYRRCRRTQGSQSLNSEALATLQCQDGMFRRKQPIMWPSLITMSGHPSLWVQPQVCAQPQVPNTVTWFKEWTVTSYNSVTYFTDKLGEHRVPQDSKGAA